MNIMKTTTISALKPLCLVLFTLLFFSCKQENEKSSKERTSDLNQQIIEKAVKNEQTNFFGNNTIFPQIHANLNGMVSEFIWQIYEDKSDNFWFCTNHDGVIVYKGDSLKHYTLKDGLGGSAVRAIIEDDIGNIWLGTSGGLTKYNGNTFTNYSEENGLIDNEIWDIEIDKNGSIWIATVGGVSKFDGTTFETFKVPKPDVPKPKPMLSENRVSDILIDKNGHLWFVNDSYGITKFNGNQFEFFTTKNGLTDNNVADLFEDSQGNIWIGTFYGGVSKYDGNSFTDFTKDGIIEGIETYNFCEDNKGSIWFSAENFGAYRYDGKSFTQFTTKDGLATNTIQHIFEDKKGQLWFSTWSGISVYEGETFKDVSDKEPWTK